MTKSNLWKKEFVLVYGARGLRVCYSRKACQQVVGRSRELSDHILYRQHDELSGCILYNMLETQKANWKQDVSPHSQSVPSGTCFL